MGLAAPRRKNKYDIDPRNNAWANDENKFGQKLMEKFGWEKGELESASLARLGNGAAFRIRLEICGELYLVEKMFTVLLTGKKKKTLRTYQREPTDRPTNTAVI